MLAARVDGEHELGDHRLLVGDAHEDGVVLFALLHRPNQQVALQLRLQVDLSRSWKARFLLRHVFCTLQSKVQKSTVKVANWPFSLLSLLRRFWDMLAAPVDGEHELGDHHLLVGDAHEDWVVLLALLRRPNQQVALQQRLQVDLIRSWKARFLLRHGFLHFTE